MAAVQVFFLVAVFVVFCGETLVLGKYCTDKTDCFSSQVCCKPSWSLYYECADSCIGKYCTSNSNCGDDYCCDNTCRTSCLGHSCILHSDCGGENEFCCDYACQKGTCDLPAWVIVIIVISVLCGVGTFLGVVLCVYCAYKRSRSPGIIVSGAPATTMPTTTMVPGPNHGYEDQGPPPAYQPLQPQTILMK